MPGPPEVVRNDRRVQQLGIVVTTLGRLDALDRLLASLEGALVEGDEVVLVAQRHEDAVRELAAAHRDRGLPVSVIRSEPGAARGRNAGVAALSAAPEADPMLMFPNDTTWVRPGAVEAVRSLPEDTLAGAITVVDENGPRSVHPPAGTPLDRWTAMRVVEMSILLRRSVFVRVGGFDSGIGTGAPTPWQAGEATDLLMRVLHDPVQGAELARGFAWLDPEVSLGGVPWYRGLSPAERRRKLRAYSRGHAHVVARWRYPLWYRAAILAAAPLFGFRHRPVYRPSDGWPMFLGHLEGLTGLLLGPRMTAVTR